MQLGDDFDADLKENQQAQKPPEELEGRKCTLTQKGFEYQLPFKKKLPRSLSEIKKLCGQS